MKKVLTLLAFTCLWFSAFGQVGEKNFIDQNYIEVTGTAEMMIVPDKIEITISVTEKDFKTKQSFADYEKMIIAKLKEIGIPVDKDFMIADMNSRFKYRFISKNGVVSSKQYLLIVHDASTANKVFEEFENLGITNIAVTKLDHSLIEKYRREVKINAIKVAKEKAEALAGAINQSIGKAIYISELNNNFGGMENQYRMSSNTLMEVNNEEPGLDFQKIRVKFSISVKFELK